MSSSAITTQVVQLKAGNIQNQADSSSIYSSGQWSFKNSTAVASVTISDAGNVGIGTASPAAKLHVDAGINGAAIFKNLYNFGAANYAIAIQGDSTVRGYITQNPAAGGLFLSAGSTYYGGGPYRSDGTAPCSIGLNTSGNIAFHTNAGVTAGGNYTPSERFRIDASGEKVFLNGAIAISSSAIGASAGTYPVKWNASSGYLSYDTSSRLVKDQIEDIPYGLASVLSLQPRKYFRTDDQKEEIGFIADEVQSIIPEVVPMVEKKVFTKDEQDTELIPGGVNYDKLTAVLVKAIQEQQAQIEALKAEVAALKAP